MKQIKHRLTAIILGIGMLFSATASVHAQSQWLDKVTLYFPNRILDILDVFSLNIGVGLTAHASLRATHEVEVGGGFSATAQMIRMARKTRWSIKAGSGVSVFGSGGVASRAGQDNKIQENGGKSSFFLDFSEKWLIVL